MLLYCLFSCCSCYRLCQGFPRLQTRDTAVGSTTIRFVGFGKNETFLTVSATFALTGGNYITLTASVSDTFGNPISPVECSFVRFGVCSTCVKLTKVVRFKMAARRVNMRYSTKKTVELVLNEGSDLEDFSF